MKKLLVANWKLNPDTEKEAEALAKAEDAKGVVICPPFPFIEEVGEELKKAALGAQDVFWESNGAYTGEVSPFQLKDIGVEYVIVGHSERRALGETDKMVNKKVKAGLAHGFKVILCVGEPVAVRKKGTTAVLRYVRAQLAKATRAIPLPLKKGIIVAYEPIWAIGTGTPCDPFEAERMVHACAIFLQNKSGFKDAVGLYGGSVTEKNVKAFFFQKEIDGALVGGASLRPEEFKRMIKIVSEMSFRA